MRGLPRAEPRGRARSVPDENDRTEVRLLVDRLEPVMQWRVATAARLSPETLPDEILLLESVMVLRKELNP
jgi:hypothetical protein